MFAHRAKGTWKGVSQGTEETTFQGDCGSTGSRSAPYRRWVGKSSTRRSGSRRGTLRLGSRGGLRGLHGGGGHCLEVGFCHVGRLLGGLVHTFIGIVGGGDGRLDQGHGVFGAGRRILHGGV